VLNIFTGAERKTVWVVFAALSIKPQLWDKIIDFC